MKRLMILLMGLLLILLPACAEEWDDSWNAFAQIEGSTLIINDGVKQLGNAMPWYVYDAEEDKFYYDLDAEDEWFQKIEESDGEDGTDSFRLDQIFIRSSIDRIILPDTLKALDEEALASFHLKELTLPASLERLQPCAVVYSEIGTLRIEANVTPGMLFEAFSEHTSVGAYDVPADHPLYMVRDGVLFSKDGSVLFFYPDGKTDTHYDVPAGVRVIRRSAFAGCEALKTISLPIGLEEIGDWAFYGCDRLQELTLPLTVTRVGRNICGSCVSLEKVSAPDGLILEKYRDDGYPNDIIFRGDNGDTMPEEEEAWGADPISLGSMWETNLGKALAVVCRDDTLVYADAEASVPDGTLTAMQYCLINYTQYDMGGFDHADGGNNWVALSDLKLVPGETFFTWHRERSVLQLPARASVYTSLPSLDKNVPGATGSPTSIEISSRQELFISGPFIGIQDCYGEEPPSWFLLHDLPMTREPDGMGNVFGIASHRNPCLMIPLYDQPGGTMIKALISGTQLKRTGEKQDRWIAVSDGVDEGWIRIEQYKAIPEYEEEK